MTDTVLVALIGVGGTLLGMFGNSIVERAKAKSERRLYITKVRFDHEFEIYQTLSEKHLTMVYDIGTAVLVVRGASFPEGVQSIKDFCYVIAQHIDEADVQNKRSAPFISKEIFNSYKELGELSRSALSRFDLWRIICESSQEMVQFNHQYYDKRKAQLELEEYQKQLSHLSDDILDQVRNHLISENNE